MRVLALDSSTMMASVAVVDGDRTATRESGANTHSESLIVLIDECLQELGLSLADLDGVAIGAGPGSFTGLRIGMATAKGLCFAADKPLWLVSSLAALASDMVLAYRDSGQSEQARLLVPVLDARRQEIFVGFFQCSSTSDVESVGDEIVIAPELLGERIRIKSQETGRRQVVLGGDGVALYRDRIAPDHVDWDVLTTRLTPSASAVARLALASDQQNALKYGTPAYIRLSEAEIKFPDGNPGGSFSLK
jgi:tRNA threonylcarbamoyladenosine biosynthesis protein TsaB